MCDIEKNFKSKKTVPVTIGESFIIMDVVW